MLSLIHKSINLIHRMKTFFFKSSTLFLALTIGVPHMTNEVFFGFMRPIATQIVR